MPNAEKKFARLSGRTTREAWAELQRRQGEPHFDAILAHLEKADGTLRLSDVERAVEIAAGENRHKDYRFVAAVAPLPAPVVQALQQALDASIAAQGASKGNIQLLDRDGVLRIVVQRGLGQDFLEHFECVRADGSSVCARSFRSGSPLVIRDVYEDPAFAPHLAVAKSSGFRAVQSIPLLSRAGGVIGMLSVHFESPLPSADWRMQSLHASATRASAVLADADAARDGLGQSA